jgi:hypothetical protein
MRWKFVVLSFWCTAFLAACNQPAAKDKGGDADKKSEKGKSEKEVEKAFADLQAAIKAKDVDKIWGLLSKDSHADTEREAKAVKAAYEKMAEKDKPDYEMKIGLSAKDIADMTGKTYVKSKTFFTKEVAELVDSKFDKAELSGESGKVHYTEDDGKGQKEKMSIAREEGQWKFTVDLPKAVLK